MTPSNREGQDPGIDVDLGSGFDVDVSTDKTHPEGVTTHLIRFSEQVTPEQAETVLGKLDPTEENIVLAAGGAAIVQAGPAFVDYAQQQSAVDLVHRVQLQTWEPNRHQRQANPD